MLKKGKLQAPPELDASAAADELIEQLSRIDWIVDSQPTPPELKGTDAAINYVARYTCGAVIGNRRMISDDGTIVKFRYKDYTTGEERIEAILGEAFTGRFGLHILPKSFSRVRYAGLFRPCGRKQRLAQCRSVMPGQEGPEEELVLTVEQDAESDTSSPVDEEESMEEEEQAEEDDDCGKPTCACCKKQMSFARRIDGEMTLQLLALSARIVLRMLAGSQAGFDVLVNVAMTSIPPPGGGWLSMTDDHWEVLSSLIQTKLREATAEMESEAIPEAVGQFLIRPHPPPGVRQEVDHAVA